MEFSWGISLERRLQTILEAGGISSSRERPIVGNGGVLNQRRIISLPWNYWVIVVLRNILGTINTTPSIK